MLVSKRGGGLRETEAGWGGEQKREVLKLKCMNGNRLGNYSVVPALRGEELGGNVKMADNKMAS